MFDNNDNKFDIVIDRLKTFIGSDKDAAVGRELGVSRSNISTWRKKDSIPYKELAQWAEPKGISLNWVFYGIPPMMLDDAMDQADAGYSTREQTDPANNFRVNDSVKPQYTPGPAFDQESWDIATACVDLYINELNLTVPPSAKANAVRSLYPAIRDDVEDETRDDKIIVLLKQAAEVECQEGLNEQEKNEVVEPNKSAG